MAKKANNQEFLALNKSMAIEKDNCSEKRHQHPYNSGGQDKAIPSSLQIRVSEAGADFKPLNRYIADRFLSRIMDFVDKICKNYQAKIDTAYWKRIAQKLITAKTPDDLLIVAARAGYGKSILIKAIALALISLGQENEDIDRELSGMIIVLQKVEDLNDLSALSEKYIGVSDKIAALQSWTIQATQRGLCQNPNTHSYKDCSPNTCPFAPVCGVRDKFRIAPFAPIVGLTQARFHDWLETQHMDNALFRTFPNGEVRPRRFLVFDENPNAVRVSELSKDTLDKTSIAYTRLVEQSQISDSSARISQASVDYLIGSLFQAARNSTSCQISNSTDDAALCRFDLVAGRCRAPADMIAARKTSYENVRSHLARGHTFAPSTLKEAFAVADRLYRGEECIFCRSRTFTIYDVKLMQLCFPGQQTIIFDATAEVDGDYAHRDHLIFLEPTPKPNLNNVTFYIYKSSDLLVTKSRLNVGWRIEAFAQQVKMILSEHPQPTFLCTYKDCATPLEDALLENLDKSQMELIARTEKGSLPYLGGTNGSNRYNHCKQIILLGQPLLKPQTYLTHTCAAYGTDKVMDELDCYVAKHGNLQSAWDLMQLPSIADYAHRHTAARLEQEIYRLTIRNYGNTTPNIIHLFCPDTGSLELLLARFQGATLKYVAETPSHFKISEATARKYRGGKTALASLRDYLDSNPTFPRSSSEIRSDLEAYGVSKSAYDEMMKGMAAHSLLAEYGIKRRGRGPHAVWYFEGDGRDAAS